MEAPEHDLFRMLNSEKSKVDFDHNSITVTGFVQREEAQMGTNLTS